MAGAQSIGEVQECRIETTDRLRGEGRWEEAIRFRELRRRALRAEGKGKEEARDESWKAMCENYPPPKASAEVATDETREAGPTQREPNIDDVSLTTTDLYADVVWVYHHLSTSEGASAPSPGARGLLQWARRNQGRFFEQLLPKILLSKPASPKTLVDPEDSGIDDIEQLLEQFGVQGNEK